MIFILEDNDDRIDHFDAQLEGRPYRVERTVPEAIAWLEQLHPPVTLYCLDNDLYVPDYDGEEGEGWQLCEWILEHGEPAPILIHTTNVHAATKMEMACEAAGRRYGRVVPYFGMQWIGEAWIRAVDEILADQVSE